MGFKVKHGGPSAIVKLATLAGEADAGIRAEKMAFDSAQRLRELEHSTRLSEMQVDARMAAQENDIAFGLQKYQMQQENDFMVKEDIRMEKIRMESIKVEQAEAKIEAQRQAIDAQVDETIDKETAERMKLNLGLPSGVRLPGISEENRYERAAEMKEAQEIRSQEYHDKRMEETSQEKMYRKFIEKTKSEQLVELRKDPTREEFQESSDRNEVIVKVVGGAEAGVHKSMSIDDARVGVADGSLRPVMVPAKAVIAEKIASPEPEISRFNTSGMWPKQNSIKLWGGRGGRDSKKIVVTSPEGKQVTIDIRDWPRYRTMNYTKDSQPKKTSGYTGSWSEQGDGFFH